jgi:flavin reductase (DIM6/NTAB) family NADH-FMN oxidoreductase RutF
VGREFDGAAAEIEARAYRQALAQFATGVAVVTAYPPTRAAIGLTVTSFNAVSLQPPLVLFSVGRNNHSLAGLLSADSFAVNVLGSGQQRLSEQFSRSLSDKWCAVEILRGLGNAPLLAGALAHFECVPYATYDGGDHVIFVVRVMRFTAQSGEPLVFFDGDYRRLADEGGSVA